MQVVSTTLVAHDPKSFNGRNGPWTLHIFKDAQGNRFQTSKTDVANQCFALLNQPVTITYELETRNTQNGSYTNNVIQSVSAGASAAPAAAPMAAPASAPAAAVSAPAVNEAAPRIARSVGLEQALKAVELGVVTVSSIEEFRGVVASFANYVFRGQWAANQAAPATGAAVASTPPPTPAVVAEQAGAVAAAPAEAPVAAAPVDDDIPF